MPYSKYFISLVIFGGASITAITASSFSPGDQGQYGLAGLSEGSAFVVPALCVPESTEAMDLRGAARARLALGDTLGQGAARIPGMDTLHRASSILHGRGNEPDTATSYATFEIQTRTPESTTPHWSRHSLSSGENLAALWQNAWGLPLSTLYGLLADEDSARVLNQVYPGQEVEWRTDAQGDLDRLRLWSDRSKGHEWRRASEGADFVRREVQNARIRANVVLAGEIDQDLSTTLAGFEALSPQNADALAVLLDRHLLLGEKARDGDRFTLLIEQETLVGDESPYTVQLLAFEYHGEALQANGVRHSNDRFYTPDGRSLLPPFAREPFAGEYRISSGYNLRRRHPVTGRVARHEGTDFQMPVGTPILAPADGTVTAVETHPYAGRYIEIEHGQGYSTRYLHLQETQVTTGQQVHRNEQIALSGNTGRTTGPHLHYELHVDGRPVDAMRADLPSSENLAGKELRQFQVAAQPLLAQLRDTSRTRQVAMQSFSDLGL